MAILVFLLFLFATPTTGKPENKLLPMFIQNSAEYTSLNLTLLSGSIPSWLDGDLIRVGSGLFEYGKRSVNNVCDGLSKVHMWSFSGGRATYTARMLKSESYNKTLKDRKFRGSMMIDSITPGLSLTERLSIVAGGVNANDNANIAIWSLDGVSPMVTSEAPLFSRVSRDNLDYRGKVECDTYGCGFLSWYDKPIFSASHYARHPTRNSSFNYIFSVSLVPGIQSKYTFLEHKQTSDGTLDVRKVAEVHVKKVDYRLLHQFGTTENYIVAPRFNWGLNMNSPFRLCDDLVYYFDKPFYVDVISIESGKVTTFSLAEAQRGVHIVNSFERLSDEGEVEVVLDAPVAANGADSKIGDHCMFDVLKLTYLRSPDRELYEMLQTEITLRRFVMNMATGTMTTEDFPGTPRDTLIDFPYINPLYQGHDYCYAYLQNWDLKESEMSLIKYDICRKQMHVWYESARSAAEPIFVPTPAATDEDDGVIIAPVLNTNSKTSELMIWDANDMSVKAVLQTPHVPLTLHGMWFANEENLN